MANLLFFLCVSALAASVRAQVVSLGTAATFGVLGSSAVTNSGPTVINGDLGIYPNTASSVTGFPPGTVAGGSVYAGNAVAQAAQNDATSAYNTAAGMAFNSDISGQDLGGKTLVAGTYHFNAAAGLTGTLTLDGANVASSQWIFQIGTTLTTAAAASIQLINGAQACHIFWQVGSSATLGAGTQFVGNILAQTSISLNNGVNSNGGLFALTGAVTLINNVVDNGVCPAVVTPTPSTTASTTATTTATTTASTTSSATEVIVSGSSTITTVVPVTVPVAPTTSTGTGQSLTGAQTLPSASVHTTTTTLGQPPGQSPTTTRPGGTGIGGPQSLPPPSGSPIIAPISGTGGSVTVETVGFSVSGSSTIPIVETLPVQRLNSPEAIQTQSLALLFSLAQISASLIALEQGIINTASATGGVHVVHVQMVTFVATCTSAPATITSYDQTFTIAEVGTTTITCPYTQTTNYVTFTASCTSAPSTIYTYDQTFTLTETGTSTITCASAAFASTTTTTEPCTTTSTTPKSTCVSSQTVYVTVTELAALSSASSTVTPETNNSTSTATIAMFTGGSSRLSLSVNIATIAAVIFAVIVM